MSTDIELPAGYVRGDEFLSAQQRARNRAAYWVVKRSNTRSGRRALHLPADPDSRVDPSPLCVAAGEWNMGDVTWFAKDLACYPPGYAPICKRCRSVIEADDDE